MIKFKITPKTKTPINIYVNKLYKIKKTDIIVGDKQTR